MANNLIVSGSIDGGGLDITEILTDVAIVGAAALAAFARQELAAAEKIDTEAWGYLPKHTTIVDGVVGAREDQVKPNGEIDYVFESISGVVQQIFALLEAHAPVRSGQYKASIRLTADDVEVADPLGQVPPAAQRYVFLPDVPYARKIEGADGRPPESPQAPNGVFEAVAAIAAHQFGNQADIAFTFIAADSGTIATRSHSVSARELARHRGRRRESSQLWLTAAPAIVVTMRAR
jgi:hypothetical protein